MDTISNRIQVIIDSHNLTASSFADKIGVQKSSISHVLSGRNKPSMVFIQKILTHFPKVNAQWLLTGEVPGKSNSEEVAEKVVEKENAPTHKVGDKTVQKIVFFYADGTFETYTPTNN